MTSTNTSGNKTSTATWLAVLISAVSLTFVITYAGAKASGESRMNRMESDLREIKVDISALRENVTSKVDAISKDLQSRVEKAGVEHREFEVRIDRLENKR